jgi:hypothetical protein
MTMMVVTDLWHGTAKYLQGLIRVGSGSADHRGSTSVPTHGGDVDPSESTTWEADTTMHGTVPVVAPVEPASSRLSGRPAGRAPRPALQGLLAFAAYLAVFIAVYARPLISHLNQPNLRQYWTDPNFYTWAMQWWPYAVSHGINPLFSSQIGAPHGYDLAWASTTPSVGLLMWPVTAAFGVVMSYNVMLLLVPPVSAWACFLAARRLTGRFWPSLLAGAVYGFCPFELVHNWQGQPNLTVIALFPLMVYLVLRWWDGTLKPAGFVLWMTLAMAVQFYTFNEAFADMTAVLAGGLVIGFAVAGRAAWRKVARLAGLTAVAYTGAIIAAAPYLYYALKHYPKDLARQDPEYSLRLVRLVLPWSDKVFGLTALVHYSDRLGRAAVDDYVGLPLLLVLLGIAVFAWRSRISRLLVIGFVFVIGLAAGPDLMFGNRQRPLPWGGLWSLPIARSAEPSRLVVFAILALALALALWLAAPAASTTASRLLSAARWGLGLLAVAAILVDTPTAHEAVNPVAPGYQPPAVAETANQLPAFITQGMYRRYLRPGEIVVIYTDRGNAAMLFQAAAGFYFRIAGGFINASLTTENALPHPLTLPAHPSRLADQMFEDYLRSAGIGAILVEQNWEDPWMQNFSTKYRMQGTSAGGMTIYPVGPWLANQTRLAQRSRQAHQAHPSRETHRSQPA